MRKRFNVQEVVINYVDIFTVNALDLIYDILNISCRVSVAVQPVSIAERTGIRT